jgi:hypothetical protein
VKGEIVTLPQALTRCEESKPPERNVHLLCLLDHMFDQDIQVNGILYHVSEDGWLPDVPESAAKKLLQNPDCWNMCFDAPETQRQITNGAAQIGDGEDASTIKYGLTGSEEAELRQLYQNYGMINDPRYRHYYSGSSQSPDADAAYARQQELLSRRSCDAPPLRRYDAAKTRRRGRPAKGKAL